MMETQAHLFSSKPPAASQQAHLYHPVSQPRGPIPLNPLSTSPVMCHVNQGAPLVSGVGNQEIAYQTLVSDSKLSLSWDSLSSCSWVFGPHINGSHAPRQALQQAPPKE